MRRVTDGPAGADERTASHTEQWPCDAIELPLDSSRENLFAYQHPLLRCQGPHLPSITDGLDTVRNETGSFIAVAACGGADDTCIGHDSTTQMQNPNDDAIDILEQHGNGSNIGGCFCAHISIGMLSFPRGRAPGASTAAGDCVLS